MQRNVSLCRVATNAMVMRHRISRRYDHFRNWNAPREIARRNLRPQEFRPRVEWHLSTRGGRPVLQETSWSDHPLACGRLMSNVGEGLVHLQGPLTQSFKASDGLEREIHHLGDIRDWPYIRLWRNSFLPPRRSSRYPPSTIHT